MKLLAVLFNWITLIVSDEFRIHLFLNMLALSLDFINQECMFSELPCRPPLTNYSSRTWRPLEEAIRRGYACEWVQGAGKTDVGIQHTLQTSAFCIFLP